MSEFKCAICLSTFKVDTMADQDSEELEMQEKWGGGFDLDDCEPVCPKCFAMFFGDEDND